MAVAEKQAASMPAMAPVRRRAHRHWREKFDPAPTAVYVWAKRLFVRGRWVAVGDVVDREAIATHKLRFMWRAGIVTAATPTPTPAPKPTPKPVQPTPKPVQKPGQAPATVPDSEMPPITDRHGEAPRRARQ